ncbi:helix-turn-helix transcriptional regulator [Sphingobium phenoxybenzoativorans]|uniref:Helix-turn-helix transcriptional regulator n=1 Tax=Sphingobium phenoxybenzoativorans TaxID=1592790 RepID=A0A975K9N3_9SPHN|nr:AraC family transcriptional regulator [Sphingobium phenoxybenzoativorans]QUT05977.1 helix-turn-helix transcriptional regulator [Sphingobium phenoxybenzoativorans]
MIEKQSGIQPDLCLRHAGRPLDLSSRLSRSWRGFAVELVSVDGASEFSFQRVSNNHYLALHDIVLDQGQIRVDDLAMDQRRDLRGTITFLPSGCSVQGWSAATARTNSFTALYFDATLLREEMDMRYREASLAPVLYARGGPLPATMRKFQTVFADQALDSLHAESACLIAAIEVLSLPQMQGAGRLTARQTSAVIDYIGDNLAHDLSLSDLAGVAGLSRYHFGRAFKTTTGQSPYAFILQRRVDAAAEMMATSRMSVEQVAEMCGFRTTANLRRKFQQAKGMTPLAFRRSVQ